MPAWRKPRRLRNATRWRPRGAATWDGADELTARRLFHLGAGDRRLHRPRAVVVALKAAGRRLVEPPYADYRNCFVGPHRHHRHHRHELEVNDGCGVRDCLGSVRRGVSRLFAAVRAHGAVSAAWVEPAQAVDWRKVLEKFLAGFDRRRKYLETKARCGLSVAAFAGFSLLCVLFTIKP